MNSAQTNPSFEALLEYLKHSRGFDFSGYKRSTLTRRVNKRMQSVEAVSYEEYVDYLEVHPDEFGQLFNTILINVTAFFRDGSAWEYIAKEIIPSIVARKALNEPIRIWSAGCASGEEAYTLAMVFAEAVGLEEFRERVKIYATDMDEEALNQARASSYEAKDLADMPEALRDKYFDLVDTRYIFHKDLRRSVIFGRHDLVQDAPISRIDLLVCRNTLMYFNAETQTKILARFHFALNQKGILFLGKAETLLTHTNYFTPVDLKSRIFSKVGNSNNIRERLLLLAQADHSENIQNLSSMMRIREAAFDTGPIPQIVVDLQGFVVLANDRAKVMFNLATRDLGSPLQDLELSYRPVELRSCIEKVYAECRPVIVRDIECPCPNGEVRYLEVQLTPLMDVNGVYLGVSITFSDVSLYKRLQQELQQSNQELEMAYEELQSTNEELETTNEELQSTVEELETTNEELQSTNEELETMNEELQSTNEELQTINDELRQRSEELNQVNVFLASILTSLRSGVAVLNREMEVVIWNDKADDLWGLRATEVYQKHFLNLDFGLPVGGLRQPIRACLNGECLNEEVIITATNRRGRSIQCKVTCTPLMEPQDKVIHGAILLMDEIDKEEPAALSSCID
ncbi:PAS domain-containing protein [Ancylothrix sp. C2]|uniref:CheR family methyltransferase n=1 Tax=Ancylothrix sp. D3o TaxID=2953691 RepID=UPI0021BB7344|nr:CheR family methyltransferase [Ancylothrix sp. D3o]MCT7948816.1 PAS domain-containing protein [Ancylothrix sp. D3o]